MTRILVLSDTHITEEGRLPSGEPKLLEDLAGYIQAADLILHSGDHTGVGFYWELKQVGNVVSVCGNMDASLLRKELPERTIVDCEAVRIGITHGWGPLWGLESRVYESWAKDKPDVIVFGHTHQDYQSRRRDTLLFNPGSPTAPRGRHPTVGWLEIDQKTINAQIIRLPKHGKYP